MATLVEPTRSFEFLISVANGDRSFEEVSVDADGAALIPGQVLGKVTAGAAGSAAAQSGNTGNATVGTVTKLANVQVGTYVVEFVSATEFIVIAPDGDVVGNGQTGTAFSEGTHLSFTITAGGTPMVAGDGFTIAIAAGTGEYVAYDEAGIDGSSVVAGILCIGVDLDAVENRAIVARDATVKKYKLEYDGTEATVLAGLAALGIVAR